MKVSDVFGFLLVLLAIYLAVNATARGDISDGLFDGGRARIDDVEVDPNGGKLSADRDRRPAGNEGVVTRSDFCRNVSGQSQFNDLGDEHDEAIRCMAAADVVTGVSRDTYAPRDALTRAQAASFIAAMIRSANRLEEPGVNLRGLPEGRPARFSDVPPDSTHADAIGRLSEAGIIEGYVDARFEPRGRVSRAQMASILDRTYKYMTGDALPGGGDHFTDDDRSVHEDSINAVAEAGIIGGSNSRFRPSRSVRRGPMATFLARTMIRLEETDRIMPLP
jgi:hypothetical protein